MSFVTDSILKTALGKIKAWGEGKFVAQETGKGLSSNDYTSASKFVYLFSKIFKSRLQFKKSFWNLFCWTNDRS